LYAAWRLGALTGMRRGELLGLRWSDLDLDQGWLSVRQALVVVDRQVQASEPKTARGRRFERRARRAGLPPIRFHDLRHTHATLALQAGVHPKVISERLGHATVAMTLDIYSHAIPALQHDAATTIANLVSGAATAAGGLG
jgi:integrase